MAAYTPLEGDDDFIEPFSVLTEFMVVPCGERPGFTYVMDLPEFWKAELALQDFVKGRLDGSGWITRGETVEEC